jgi:enterobactin synthetase component D
MRPLDPSALAPIWFRPPSIFGPDVRAWATFDLQPPSGTGAAGGRVQSPRRIGEFAAGRRCAARALREAGAQDVTVGVGAAREPVWPAGFTGSITHSTAYACAAVAATSRLRSIGVDFEPIFDDAAMREVALVAATERERTPGAVLTAEERVTLVFSAKESLYKCIYPLARVFFDFTDAEIDVSAREGAFRARLLRDLGSGFARGSEFEGRYAIADGHVHTVLELRT